MKFVKIVLLGIICSQQNFVNCDIITGLFGDIEPSSDYKQPMKINNRVKLSLKRKNDESYRDYTVFPSFSDSKKDLSRESAPPLRGKRSEFVVIGKSKSVDDTGKTQSGKVEQSSVIHLNLTKISDINRENGTSLKLNQNAADNDEVSVPELQNRRLIHGRDANIEDYPYVVSIQKNGEHWCAGAIINPVVVVTTANCVWKSKGTTKMTVRVGSRRADSGGTVVGIKTVVKHPDWSVRKDPDCDIALLKLNISIKFKDGLHAAELPNESMMPPFSDVWVTSWGTERPDGQYDAHDPLPLQVYHALLVDREECNNVTSHFQVNVTDTFICLAQAEAKAPCTRDTGAPAVSDGVVWGLASWGLRKTCGTERSPAMFSYVAAPRNLDFITRASSDLLSEERSNPYIIDEK